MWTVNEFEVSLKEQEMFFQSQEIQNQQLGGADIIPMLILVVMCLKKWVYGKYFN